MFLITSVLSGPDKLFLETAVIVIVGLCLHWLFTETPKCPNFATMDFVVTAGSWDSSTALDSLNQAIENGKFEKGRLNKPWHISEEFSEFSSNVSETVSVDTSAKEIIFVNQESEGFVNAQTQSKIVVDSEVETLREVSEEVINVESANGKSHGGNSTKSNKNVGSKVQKTVDAKAILASLILEDSAPKKAQSDLKMQAKKRRKNNAKDTGKKKGKKSANTKAKKKVEIFTEKVLPEIEAGDSFTDPNQETEPEFYASKNPFFLLSGLGDEECWKSSTSPDIVEKSCEEVSDEVAETIVLPNTIECRSIVSSVSEKKITLSQCALPILALNCNEIFLPAPSPSPSPDASEDCKSPETPNSFRSPETPRSPWTPNTIDDDGFDYSELMEKRKRNRSPAREYTQSLKEKPVLLPLRDTVEEWRKASSSPLCPSPVKSGTTADGSEWQIAGGKRKATQTWAQVASMSTPASNPLWVKKTTSKEVKPNIVVFYKRKHAPSV